MNAEQQFTLNWLNASGVEHFLLRANDYVEEECAIYLQHQEWRANEFEFSSLRELQTFFSLVNTARRALKVADLQNV